MEFFLKNIDKGITTDIVNKGITLDKKGITSWLRAKNLMNDQEELISFIDINPWIRTGSETYSNIFEFTTDHKSLKVFVKALVTLSPEKSLKDWERRRKILLENSIPVSEWLWAGEATIFEPFYPKTYLETNDFNKLLQIATIIDELGFTTLKFLDDILCDNEGNPFYNDFGFDLGEPSNLPKLFAKEYLTKVFPYKAQEIDSFYFDRSNRNL
jgi:hypothetical protein